MTARTPVRFLTFSTALADASPINAWFGDADQRVWADIALAMRAAERLAQSAGHAFALSHRRAELALASGEIAKARELARFLIDPGRRKDARRTINKVAAFVRVERGA